MSLVASMPGGLGQIGIRRLCLTGAAFCLAPALVGGLVLAVAAVLGPHVLGVGHLRTQGLATFALVSPLVGGPIWGLVVLGSALLLRAGLFGSLPAAGLGLVAFAVLTRTEVGLASLPFGAASVLLYRMALALQRPEVI
ncbi:MAG: hypothetical protein KBF78_12975 [Fuscovulum sp.]|nr:hypothetical protein [Fuscovulum sp.]